MILLLKILALRGEHMYFACTCRILDEREYLVINGDNFC